MQLQFKVENLLSSCNFLCLIFYCGNYVITSGFQKNFNGPHRMHPIIFLETWSYCDKHLYKKLLWYWTNLYWIKHLMGCIQCRIEILVQCPKPSTFTFTFTKQKHLYSQCDYKWKSFTLPHLLHVGQGECKF
jgi:hypothetical protein